nr:unnamed protein product [Digitaria exilis]
MASTSLAALPSQLASPNRLRRGRAALSSTARPHVILHRAAAKGGSRCRLAITCNAQAVAPTSIAQGTPVRPTSILVVGATGTLGRQVVRRALDEGYDVRCLVRPRPAPADFLRDWGATVVNADLSKPETIPATLVEKFIQDSGLDYIIIRLCGFMQGLIGQYAVPILEEKSVWGTDAPTRIAYMDTQDVARLTFIAMRNEKAAKKLLTFAGPRAWTTQEVLSSDTVFSAPMNETYQLLGVDANDILSLEKYLQDYFTNILKKLKDLKAQSKQTDIFF